MDVDTFKVRLAALPFLSKSEIQSYQQRVLQGRTDPQTLYREALALHQGRRSEEIGKKRRDLERRLANLNLNYDDLNFTNGLVSKYSITSTLKYSKF